MLTCYTRDLNTLDPFGHISHMLLALLSPYALRLVSSTAKLL